MPNISSVFYEYRWKEVRIFDLFNIAILILIQLSLAGSN